MPPILKQRQINYSPARIAFPGWVSLAFPAGAAAARHRGLTNVPFSVITTNLLASLLSKCGPERGAQALVRLRCADDACQTRTEVPAAPFPDSERTPAPSRKFGCSMCDVCCPSPWQRRDATEGGRRGLGRAPPGNTAAFMRRSRSTPSSRAERSAPVCVRMKMPQRPGLGRLCWSSHTLHQHNRNQPSVVKRRPGSCGEGRTRCPGDRCNYKGRVYTSFALQ